MGADHALKYTYRVTNVGQLGRNARKLGVQFDLRIEFACARSVVFKSARVNCVLFITPVCADCA